MNRFFQFNIRNIFFIEIFRAGELKPKQPDDAKKYIQNFLYTSERLPYAANTHQLKARLCICSMKIYKREICCVQVATGKKAISEYT